MAEVTRVPYIFCGPKAEKAAGYYDVVVSHGFDGDMEYLVWDAAHKFGARVVGPGFASYHHGMIIGNRAKEAAEYFDNKWDDAFQKCQEVGRRKIMREVADKLKCAVEKEYEVKVKVFNKYYY